MLHRALRTLIIVAACSTAACSRAVVGVSPRGVPLATATGGSVAQESFFSDVLGVRKRLVVYLPRSYTRESTRRYPVVYYLHGLSGSQGDWVSKGGIDGIADSLFGASTPEMILVMPDGDDGWYTNWTSQFSYRACADTLKAEWPESYCVEHQRYDDYIVRDVVGFIDSHYRTLATREHRGIAGLSMGGYGALSLALHHPDVFAAAASHSGVVSPLYIGPRPFAEPARYALSAEELRPPAGSFWPRYQNFWGTDMARWKDADPAHTAADLRARGTRMPALFFDCGVDDGLLDQNRALHAELTKLGIAHQYAEWPGAHTWRYWSTHVRESLSWISAQVAR
jgi:putative tributyrin esterase